MTRLAYENVAVAVPVTVPYVRYSTHGAHWFIGQALDGLLRASGLDKRQIDGLTISSFSLGPDTAVGVTQHLGVSPRWLDHLPNGGDLPSMSISLFSEANYGGVGFGLGFSVTLDTAKALIPGSVGDYSWGGAASTYFWIDPKEELIAIFMTQLMPSTHYPVRREFRTLVYSAFTKAN